MHVRVCAECGEEYRPGITLCADCGGELQDRYEDEQGRQVASPDATGDAGEGPAEETIPGKPLFAGMPASIKLLADTLVAAGIPFQLLPEARLWPSRVDAARLVLVVPEPDGARALDALVSFRGRSTELGLAELATIVTVPETPDGDAVPCPACGTEIAPSVRTCPECGLGFEDGASDDGASEP